MTGGGGGVILHGGDLATTVHSSTGVADLTLLTTTVLRRSEDQRLKGGGVRWAVEGANERFGVSSAGDTSDATSIGSGGMVTKGRGTGGIVDDGWVLCGFIWHA